MSRPPDDDFPDVMAQVEAALDGLDVADHATREALLDGVREALRAASDDDDDDDSPNVEVVEGGRHEDTPVSGERPSLRVAEPGESAPSGIGTSVRLVRATRGTSNEGAILIDPEPGDTEWQPVFHGETARTYRIRCVGGRFRVTGDGAAVGALRPGQSVDVEALSIRIGADEPSEGRYLRIG